MFQSTPTARANAELKKALKEQEVVILQQQNEIRDQRAVLIQVVARLESIEAFLNKVKDIKKQ